MGFNEISWFAILFITRVVIDPAPRPVHKKIKTFSCTGLGAGSIISLVMNKIATRENSIKTYCACTAYIMDLGDDAPF